MTPGAIVRGLAAFVVLIGSTRPATDQEPPTLATVVGTLGVTPDGLPANLLGRKITSFATTDDGGIAAIAYYVAGNDRALDPPLYLAVREPGRPWRQGELRRDSTSAGFGFGSALKIWVLPTHVLIDTHANPSAGTIAVVRRDSLTLAAALDGWVETMLPTGLLIYTHNMIHWAPAHPQTLDTYDFATRRAARLYPTDELSPLRRAFMDQLRPALESGRKSDPNNAYGWSPEWFDVSVDRDSLEYDNGTDALRFNVTFSSDRTPEASRIRMDLRVVCRQMKLATRTCVESKRE